MISLNISRPPHQVTEVPLARKTEIEVSKADNLVEHCGVGPLTTKVSLSPVLAPGSQANIFHISEENFETFISVVKVIVENRFYKVIVDLSLRGNSK